jgi:hypothetical protein
MQRIGTQMIGEGLKNLDLLGRMAGVPQPQMNNSINGFANLIQSLQGAAQGNAQLDSLSVEELKTRYEAAQKRLEAARAEFEQALVSRNQTWMGQAQAEKQKCMSEVYQLTAALQKKGVIMQQPQPPQPQCAQQ